MMKKMNSVIWVMSLVLFMFVAGGVNAQVPNGDSKTGKGFEPPKIKIEVECLKVGGGTTCTNSVCASAYNEAMGAYELITRQCCETCEVTCTNPYDCSTCERRCTTECEECRY